MLQDLLFNVLSGELSKMGRDGEGNIVISPQSMDELSHRITTIIHDSIARPVVTISHADIGDIGAAAGFRPALIRRADGVAYPALIDPESERDCYNLVNKVADHAIRLCLRRVQDQTGPKERGDANGG